MGRTHQEPLYFLFFIQTADVSASLVGSDSDRRRLGYPAFMSVMKRLLSESTMQK